MDPLTNAILDTGRGDLLLTEKVAWLAHQKTSGWKTNLIGAGLGAVGMGALGYRKFRANAGDPLGRSKAEIEAQRGLRVMDAAIDPHTNDTTGLDRLKRKWTELKLEGATQAKKAPGVGAATSALVGAGVGAGAVAIARPAIKHLMTKHAEETSMLDTLLEESFREKQAGVDFADTVATLDEMPIDELADLLTTMEAAEEVEKRASALTTPALGVSRKARKMVRKAMKVPKLRMPTIKTAALGVPRTGAPNVASVPKTPDPTPSPRANLVKIPKSPKARPKDSPFPNSPWLG